ncbi:hypothetical protein GV793_01795 [Nocardia cyriacigeorgica]|nr:hypothetical protein [Nocardia cyriacigeorgica]
MANQPLRRSGSVAALTPQDRGRPNRLGTMPTQTHRATIAEWTGTADDELLRDPNLWVDALTVSPTADPRGRGAAHSVAVIADNLGGEAGYRLRTWRGSLADAHRLADRIEDAAAGFESDLGWLYALRNTALHDEQFTCAPAAIAAVAAARLGLSSLTLVLPRLRETTGISVHPVDAAPAKSSVTWIQPRAAGNWIREFRGVDYSTSRCRGP